MIHEIPGNPWVDFFEHNTQQASKVLHEGKVKLSERLSQEALANATLALAFEQRTATLVHALLSDSLVTDDKYDELQAEVRKRLGLGGSND